LFCTIDIPLFSGIFHAPSGNGAFFSPSHACQVPLAEFGEGKSGQRFNKRQDLAFEKQHPPAALAVRYGICRRSTIRRTAFSDRPKRDAASGTSSSRSFIALSSAWETMVPCGTLAW
jgi:hypothetical protein